MLGSRCSTRPIFRPVRTASWAAAILSSRPSATGNTMPGNSTRLRVATIGTASEGNSIWGASADIFSVWSIVLLVCSRKGGGGQLNFQQAIDVARFDDFHSSRQGNPSDETAMRYLQTPDD